jgi:hypothetical protein
MTPLAIFIGEGLAIITTRDPGSNFSHIHQAVPKPVAIDLKVFSGCGHLCLLLPCCAFRTSQPFRTSMIKLAQNARSLACFKQRLDGAKAPIGW